MFFKKIHEKFEAEIEFLTRGDKKRDIDKEIQNQEELRKIMQVLQLLAEGHNKELQRYIKFQDKNYHSYDLLTDITLVLNAYLKR